MFFVYTAQCIFRINTIHITYTHSCIRLSVQLLRYALDWISLHPKQTRFWFTERRSDRFFSYIYVFHLFNVGFFLNSFIFSLSCRHCSYSNTSNGLAHPTLRLCNIYINNDLRLNIKTIVLYLYYRNIFCTTCGIPIRY